MENTWSSKDNKAQSCFFEKSNSQTFGKINQEWGNKYTTFRLEKEP